MSAPYNLTNLTGGEDFSAVFGVANSLSGDWLATLTVVAVFVIAFVAFKSYGNKEAFVGASFGTLVLAIIINSMVPVNGTLMIALFIATAAGVASLVFDGGYGV